MRFPFRKIFRTAWFAYVGMTSFLVAATLFVASPAVAQEQIKPRLSINIPGVSFADIQVQATNTEAGISGYIDIPWIAQYMKGVYSYAVGIAGLLAGVMFVIGGFYILTAGGDASRVMKGKQRITDAIIGMLLVFGAYIVLVTVNPELTTFEALRVKQIKRNPFTEALYVMGTTTDPTMEGGHGEASGGTAAPRPSSGPPPAVGAHTPTSTSCPVPLTEAATSLTAPPGPGRIFKRDPRSRQFFEMMSAQVASLGNMREKILRVADAAANCGVHMNSCGSGAGAVLSIAGVGNGPGCIDMSNPHSCWAQETSGMTTPRGGSVSRSLFFDVINSKCGVKEGAACGAADCSPEGPAAVARARRILQAGVPGYPDSFANLLQPGDILWVYNANGGNCTGLHSVIFMGWAANGKAQVVQGQDGRAMRAGQTCISTRCNTSSGNYTPPIRIYRARGL